MICQGFGAQNSGSLTGGTPKQYALAWKANGLSGMVKEKPGEAIVVEVADTLAIANTYECQR